VSVRDNPISGYSIIIFYVQCIVLIVIKLILTGTLLLFCFVIPLHVYSIGADQGIGIQGTFYRYQVTGYGPMMITMMQDIWYVTSGTYSQRTALTIVFWVTGSIFLVIATLINLIRPDNFHLYNSTVTGFLLIGAGLFYVVSCMAQFGPFFHGRAGISLPFGGFLLMVLGIGGMMYPSLLYSQSTKKA
jgi:hypothetical protein